MARTKKYGYSVEVREGTAVVVREAYATAQYVCESDRENRAAAAWAADHWNRYDRPHQR